MENIEGIEIIQEKIENFDESIWEHEKEKSANYIKRFKEKSKIVIRGDKIYYLHVPLGDIHLGNNGVDYEKAEYHAKLIGKCKYALGYNIGDSIDNFIKVKIIGALINQTTTPKEQIDLLQTYIEFFNNHLVLMIGGNHDRWTKEISGLDWLSPFTKKNQIAYSPDVFNITFVNGTVKYKFKFRHKYRFSSYMNPTHKSKQMLRNSDHIFDVGCVAHDHEVAMEMSYMFGEPRFHIRCGTYKVADVFARSIGYNMGKAILPCFITSPFEKNIIPFWDIEKGIDYVNYLNNLEA
jgi:hypothetical protein